MYNLQQGLLVLHLSTWWGGGGLCIIPSFSAPLHTLVVGVTHQKYSSYITNTFLVILTRDL